MIRLPVISNNRITVVKPSNAVPDTHFTSDCIPNTIAKKKNRIPDNVINCIGAVVKEHILPIAYFTSD